MDYIKFKIRYTTVVNTERKKVCIHDIESTVNRNAINELPIILNVLSHNSKIYEDNNRFPYKFPFKLS